MQPYFFPYLGYYQLAYAVEKFIFLDDVNYIKGGYINRNSVLLESRIHKFSIPVSQMSQNRQIMQHNYVGDFSKFIELIYHAYRRAPYFQAVMPMIESIALDEDQSVSRKNAKTITSVFDYLEIKRNFIFSSSLAGLKRSKGQDRILDICASQHITEYRNAINGQDIYDKSDFENAGINLSFIQTHFTPYPQGGAEFTSHLSMIDILMRCNRHTVIGMLNNYSLV